MDRKIWYLTLIALFVATGCTLKQESNTALNGNGDDAMITEEADNTVGGMTVEDALVYTDLAPEDAKKLVDTAEDLVIIDVSPTFEEKHLPGAVNYYLGDGSLERAIPTLDKSKQYLVYCNVARPSRTGAQMLIDAGFERVFRLDGDYPAWVEAGYPVEQSIQ